MTTPHTPPAALDVALDVAAIEARAAAAVASVAPERCSDGYDDERCGRSPRRPRRRARGVRVSGDADRALDRILMARGAGETRPLGSRRYAASIGRLRATVRDAPDVGRVEVMTEDVRRVLSTLDAAETRAANLLRCAEAAEAEATSDHALMILADEARDAAILRADAAEAECARLRAYIDDATTKAERALARMYDAVDVYNRIAEERDAARAEAARLRVAITAERAVRAAWLATLPACATAPAEVVAAEAATGVALAGEGR